MRCCTGLCSNVPVPPLLPFLNAEAIGAATDVLG